MGEPTGILVDRLLRGSMAAWWEPQVATKEIIRGGRREGATCGRWRARPAWPREDSSSRRLVGFLRERHGRGHPREFVPAEDGIEEAMRWHPRLLHARREVELYDGSYHDVDSSEIAFKIAGSMAFKEAARKAGLVLLEPLMKVEVVVPETYMGEVIGDANARRGRIQSMESRPGVQVIQATMPLAELFGYATDLRSITQGRGNYTMLFSHYEEAPKSVTEEVVARVSGTLGNLRR
jgi:elongation factor G